MLPQAQAQLRRLKCFSSNGWLLTINRYLSMALLHPFSGRSNKLPHMNTFKDWNGTLRVKINMQFRFIHKFVLSCPSTALDSDYTVIVIHGSLGKLAYFRPGDKVWNTIETWSAHYLDVILYKEQIYAIDSDGKIMVCDVKGENPTVAHQVAKLPWELYYDVTEKFMEAYLIESDGALRVVTRDYDDDGTCYFMVFEVDWSTNTWEEIDDLGNKALFLGYNSSFSVEVTDTSYCKPNYIYFTQDYWEGSLKYRTFGKDMGAFNFEDGSVTPFYGEHTIQRLTPPIQISNSLESTVDQEKNIIKIWKHAPHDQGHIKLKWSITSVLSEEIPTHQSSPYWKLHRVRVDVLPQNTSYDSNRRWIIRPQSYPTRPPPRPTLPDLPEPLQIEGYDNPQSDVAAGPFGTGGGVVRGMRRTVEILKEEEEEDEDIEFMKYLIKKSKTEECDLRKTFSEILADLIGKRGNLLESDSLSLKQKLFLEVSLKLFINLEKFDADVDGRPSSKKMKLE
ncbi:hypothetical protein EZV62_009252 [Acer yangbiense]|uniref:KIB1-4 beta-propeller domain-containing protein n=1 Tax=Acer yangbiense TaxID=1000413 RepID=A0A5C7IF58_9ROSI|nr:hypothetical protein EZV62_009252 [Acer yangbiense]